LNADFSNVTYVLAFDRLVVEKYLDEENGIRGRDYLEKIIQVSFDIPEPEPETIYRCCAYAHSAFSRAEARTAIEKRQVFGA
jgi:hypothetical protein